MKKITIAILMFFGTFSIASAEVGVNVGITGNMGVFSVDAEETMGAADKNKGDSATGAFAYHTHLHTHAHTYTNPHAHACVRRSVRCAHIYVCIYRV